jgi:hypothetical protein
MSFEKSDFPASRLVMPARASLLTNQRKRTWGKRDASHPLQRPPSREGKRALTVYLRPETWKQLRMLSVQIESSTQALGKDAINLLFEKHRLNRIA